MMSQRNNSQNFDKNDKNVTDFHPKIKNLFKGKTNKLRTIDDWILIETLGIGSGGYSKIKLGLHKKTGEKVALKIIFFNKNDKMSLTKKEKLLKELTAIKTINHNNVIKLISFNYNAKYPEMNGKYTECIMITLELAFGDLFEYLMYIGHFDDIATRSYFKQLIEGLEYLHQAGIHHFNLKPQNLLIDNQFRLKIADYGFATKYNDINIDNSLKYYLAPELWKGSKYSSKCEIFACGVILFMMYSGFPPFMQAESTDWWWDKYSIAVQKLNRANYLRKIIKKTQLQYTDKMCLDEKKEMESCVDDARKRMSLFWRVHQKKRMYEDDDFKLITLNLFHPNPNKRMEIKQIKKHKWYFNKALYSQNELRLYLTKKVETVNKAQQHKMRKLLEIQSKSINYVTPVTRRVVYPISNEFQRRAKEIDPKNEFIENINSVTNIKMNKKEILLLITGYVREFEFAFNKLQIPVEVSHIIYCHCTIFYIIKDSLQLFYNHETVWQFYTFTNPAEMAARIEKCVQKYGARIEIVPKQNLILIECNSLFNRFMANNKKQEIKKKVIFIIKQFVLNNNDNNRLGLLNKSDQLYLVSSKRLYGRFEPYCNIVSKFFSFPDIAKVIAFDNDMDNLNDIDNK